ncbi:MAG: serine/threonine protein kinase [Pedosphaera sp.]|nr:serine/threonine protein kinase [Pedosphaera sp.]
MKHLLLGAALLGSALSCVMAAEDWTEFRGPTGQGHSSAAKLPLEFGPEKNLAWRQPVAGAGWSSPVIANGRIYLTTATPAEAAGHQSLRVLCMDTASGRPVWSTEAFDTSISKVHGKNSQASPTPIIEGNRLYVHFGHQGSACLDLAGKVIWRNSEFAYSPVHGNGGSPIIVGDALFFSCDGSSNPFVIALNKNTGKELWRTERKTGASRKFSFSTPLLITVNGQPQIISPGSGAVCAYDPKDGHEIWRARYGEGYSVIPRPVFGHGMIFIGTGYDRPTLMAVRTDGKGDVTDSHVAWTLTKGAPNTPSALLVGAELYFVSDGGVASCVDAKTGDVHWQERVDGSHSASPLHANGRIYLTSEGGTITVLEAGRTFRVLAQNKLGERALASPAVTGDALIVRTAAHLYRFESKP